MSLIPPGSGEGPKKPCYDSEARSFLNAIKNEADNMKGFETPARHADRLYHEVREILEDTGIQSSSEAVMLLAKLGIVIEASNDIKIKDAAKEMQRDIRIRYPGLPIEDSKR